MKRLVVICGFALLTVLSLSLNAQNPNDFRTVADGNWSDVASWERYDGSNWVAATYYPGNGSTNEVTVSNSITLDVSISIPTLTITGTLTGSGNNTLTTTGNLSCSGTLSWTNNAGGAISVQGNLTISGSFGIFNRNLTVNGTTTLNGIGTFTDGSNTGNNQFSGTVTLNDASAFTSSAVTTTGRMIFGANFTHSSTGTAQIGTASIAGNLEVNSGTFSKTAAGTLTVTGTTTLNGSGALNITSNSQSDFEGKVTLNGSSTWTTTAVNTTGRLTLANGLEQSSTGTIQFGACTFQTNTQSISVADNTGNIIFTSAVSVASNLTVQNIGSGSGAGEIRFNGNVTIQDNTSLTADRTIVVYGTLNGATATATFVNNSTLEYRGVNAPMTTGVFDVDNPGTTVNYSRDGNQTVAPATYHNLIISREGTNTTNRTKTLGSGTSFNVNGNLTINEYSYLFFSNTTNNQTLTVAGNLELTASNSYLYTPNTDVNHNLVVNGFINNNGTIFLRYSVNRYTDVTLNGDGDIIKGTGNFRLRNLTLTNANPKTCSATGNIDFYSGQSGNAFTNNGGSFTATAGTFHFIDSFSINGTGQITFYNLYCGANNQTIQTLNSDITVNGTLTLNHNNTANSYLDLNGHTLNVYGNFTRYNYGEFGSSNPSSGLNLGNGNTPTITNTLYFEAGYNTLSALNHNVANSGSYYTLAKDVTIANLNIISGELRSSTNVTITTTWNNQGRYNQTANTTYFDNSGGAISINGSGINEFWNFVINSGTTVTTVNDLFIKNNFINLSDASPAFDATGGTVYINRTGATQYIQGAGTGGLNFYNLSFNSAGGKFIAKNINVSNNFSIDAVATAIFIESSTNRTINTHNLNVNGRLYIQNTDTVVHTINVSGAVSLGSGAYLFLWYSGTAYADLNLTGSGDVISGGSSTFYVHSISFNNASNKFLSYTGFIELRGGNLTPNEFTNDGGLLQAPSTTFRFRENDQTYTIKGTGDIAFGELRIGYYTRTNVVLNRDISVDANLIFHQRDASNYLDVSGHTLTLNGNHTRTVNGRIRGGGTGNLIINGSGSFTSTFAFDQTVPGTTNRLNNLTINRGASGEMRLANLLEVNNLTINNGILNSTSGSIWVHDTTTINGGEFVDNFNGGTNTFDGTLTINPNGKFTQFSSSALNLSGTIKNYGYFNKDGSGTTSFTGNTLLQGDSALFFRGGYVMVNDSVTVINQINTQNGVYVGYLRGIDSTSTWRNEGTLSYFGGTEPMHIGILDASHNPNTVRYVRDMNSQSIKSTTYHNLYLLNGGYRTMREGDITVNGDLLIGQENILYTTQFQIIGNATGKLTMLYNSELRIGYGTSTNSFPTNFVRANIILNPNSLVSFNGGKQDISHEPIYENLAITHWGEKTITGDITVNGYFQMTTGTLIFDTTKHTVTIYGDLLASNGQINMSGGGLDHELNLYGKVNQANSFISSPNSIVRYLSTADQMVFSPNYGSYANLVIDGGSTKYLEGSILVRNNLNLVSGTLRLNDFDLNMYRTATITGTFSSGNMIETNGSGGLVRQVTDANYNQFVHVYPVGSNGKYTPFTLNSITVASGTGTRSIKVRAVPHRHPSVPYTYDALNRYWDIQLTNLTVSAADANFTYSPMDVIGNEANYTVYRWNDSTFSTSSGSYISSNTMYVPSAEPLSGQWTAFDTITIRETLYSYQTGDWNNPDTWTTDPSGQHLEGSRVPTNSDNLVILQGREVYLSSDVNTKGHYITINNGGVLDLKNYSFVEVVPILEGQGKLKLATNQMPNVGINGIVEPNGGTIEYNVPDPSFELNSQPYYNNLIFNLPNPNNTAILVNNLTVYGTLSVRSGTFKIFKDDPLATLYTRIKLDVQGDLIVMQNGKIRTGTASTHDGTLPAHGTSPGSSVPRYYDVYHQVYIKGNLINNGDIRFVSDDITVVRFDTLTTRGATTVRFYGTENSKAECFGQTDFYNLIVDKGINQSVELVINASAPENFRLFGSNCYPIPYYNPNPELRKALWIRNGTLRLKGMVTIPSLTEGKGGIAGTNQTSYFIPANGALVIDDRDVTVLISADDPSEVTAAWGVSSQGVVYTENTPQELYIYGRLQINEGYLSSRFSGGVILSDQGGELIVNGGKLSSRQIRTVPVRYASFSQNGGEVELIGRYLYDLSSITDAASLQNVTFNTSTNVGLRLDGTATFNFATPTGSFSMTGGIMKIYNTTGGTTSRAFRLMTNSNNTNVSPNATIHLEIIRNTYYNLECPNAKIPSLTVNRDAPSGTNGARLYSNISVNGNIDLQNYAILYTNTPYYNLTVSGNFTISSNATYQPGLNSTIFNGNTNSTFTVNGTIDGGLYSFVVNKTSGNTLSLAGTNGNLEINGDLSILSGILNDAGYTITAKGNIINSAEHIGNGKILIAGALTDRTIGGNNHGVFGNIEVYEAVDIISSLTANQYITGDLTFTSGSINLDRFNLKLDGNLINLSPYNTQMLIRTRGLNSDGGFTRKINSNGSYLFPVGTNTDGVNRYTPAIVTVSSFADDGYITVIPVNSELPTLDQSTTGDALQYYWRIKQDNFSSLPNVDWLYTYVDNDVSGDESLYVPGRVEGSTRIHDTSGTVDILNNTITFSTHTLANADYTAAKAERFQGSVRIFYSRLTDGNWYSHAWHDGNNWSFESHTGNPAGTYPVAGDIAIIGYGGHSSHGGYHSIMVMSGTAECAELRFNSNPSGYQSRLVIDSDAAASLGKVSGIGTFMMWINPTQIPTVDADFTEFNNEATSVFNYFQHQDGTVNIPTSFTIYPNLRFEGGGGTLGNRIAIIDADILVKRNLTVDSNGILRLSSGSTGNITVEGTTNIGGYLAGIIEFPTDAERTFTTAQLNLTDNTNNRLRVLNTTLNGFVNTIRITGTGITQQNGAIDLFNGNAGDNNAVLEFTDTSNATFNVYNGSNPELYRITVNKGTSQTPTVTINAPITLGAPTDVSTKSIVLINGTLELNNSANNINLSSGGGYFQIPSTAALRLSNGNYSVTSNNNGIALYGKLRIDGNATLDLGDGSVAETRNIIYYNNLPEIQIADNATLQVQTQIRRYSSTAAGSLRYTQTGGTVTIHGQRRSGLHALLEVCNTSSQFNMSGGTINIRRGGSTRFGDLYIVPSTASVTGGEIIFSQGTLNASYTYSINVTPTLYNVTIAGNTTNNRTATVKLMNDPLRISNLFKFDNNLAVFNSNNRNTYLYGDLQFNGSWVHGTTDSVIFAGNTQTISGSPTFNHMKVKPTTSLTLLSSSSPIVNGTLHIISGQLIDGENAITVKGNIINNGVHISTNPLNAASGLKLKGEVTQNISGTGSYGLLELDNINNANLLNSVYLDNDIILTNGSLNIGEYKLSLGLNASIKAPSGFSTTRMILSNGIWGDNAGIEKTIPAGSSTFTFPIGVYNKYTPVELTVTQNSTPGQVLVKPVNSVHVGVLDPNRVLQYWWYMNSNNISDFEGQAVMRYTDGDVRGNENLYVSGQLVNDIWNKVAGTVNTANNTITFQYPTGTNSLLGEYLAGEDDAIGDSIITYFSENSGIWDNPLNWSRSDGGTPSANGPYGVKVVIRPQHTITTNGNRRTSYRMTINGRLEVGTTYGHNFSTVLGTGTLALESNTLPAGRYDDFISCSGGGVEYAGTSSYTLYNNYNTYRKLVFAGGGNKTLPNIDLTICDTLELRDSVTLIHQPNSTINLRGNLIKAPLANFDTETPNQLYELNSTGNQIINATLNTTSNRFNLLNIRNSKEITLQGPVNVGTSINIYDGAKINTTNTNILKIERSDGLGTVHPNSFIRGPLERLLANASPEYIFPIGYNNHKKNTFIVAPSGSSNSYWRAEYLEENPDDHSYNHLQVDAELSHIDTNQFWRITGPNGYKARLRFILDGTSSVAGTVTSLSSLRLVRWNTSINKWEIAGGTVTATGNANDGTIVCDSNITFNGSTQIFTIGDVEPPTAQFIAGDTTICGGDTVPIQVAFDKGTPPYSITYTSNGANPQTISGITDNPYTFYVNPYVTTEYSLSAFSDVTGNGVVIGPSVTVNAWPRPQVTVNANSPVCQNDYSDITVTLTNGLAPFSFTYSYDGVVQPQINNVNSPHSYTIGPTTWFPTGSPPSTYNDHVVRIEYLVDSNGCVNDYSIDTKPEATIRTYKVPETGPQYHIPNSFAL